MAPDRWRRCLGWAARGGRPRRAADRARGRRGGDVGLRRERRGRRGRAGGGDRAGGGRARQHRRRPRGSDFITPAIVDRDPVTVAIGTEGAAPVLARKIKAEVEAMLPATLGLLTRIGQAFRARVEALDSQARRVFWTRFYFESGPRALEAGGTRGAGDDFEERAARGMRGGRAATARASSRYRARRSGAPDAEGAAAAEADVVIHDQVPAAVLELARFARRRSSRRGRPPMGRRGSRTTSTR